MNQLDWERMQENVSIENVATVPFVYSYNPSGYTLGGSTSWLSGGISNLISDNSVYMTFRSYYSGTDTSDFVDNICDLYSPPAKGTHSNFAAQQVGPDSVYDMLKEENAGITGNWGITSSAFTLTSTHATYRYMGGTSPNVDNMKVTKLHIRYSGAGTVAIALYTGGTLTDPTGAIKRTEAYNVAVSSGWNTINVPDYNWAKNTVTWIGWCHNYGVVYYSTSSADAGDFQSARGRWDQTYPYDADETSPMPTSPSSGSFSNNWYAMYAEYETVNYNLDLEVQWTNADYNQANEELATYLRKGDNTRSLDATGGYMIIGNGMPNWGSTTGTISFWINWDVVANRLWGQHDLMETRISGSNLVLDWGATSSLTSITSFTAGKWYFIAIVWNENTDKLYLYVGDKDNPPTQDNVNNAWTSSVSTQGVTQNNFMASRGGVNPTDGRGDDLRYWNTARTLTNIQNDYNIELTGSESNLRSYFKLNNNFDDIGPNNNDGSGSGSYSFSSDVPFDAPPAETIRVDVWNGSSWQNLFTDLANGWNNVTVASYLTYSTFTIRFNGGTESGDTVQDSWYIDVTLLHVWTNKYTLEVEFTGSSSTENWNQLTWTVNSAWAIASVSVTLQLYNYTGGGAYPTSGNGYISYTSSATPNTDETKNQTITINPTHFRNASGNWKMKVKGVTETSSQFDLKVDWIEFKPTINGADFTFKNKGALTSHIVSLWILNSTYHQHYSIDIFLNSGKILSYSRADISFPSGQYVVKIVTERGNAAVYS
jgi:hypothetical protein